MAFFVGFLAGLGAVAIGFALIKSCHAATPYFPSCQMDEWF